MNWCKLGLGLVLAVSLSTGCGNGMQKVAKQEMEKYNMNSYRKGNHRQADERNDAQHLLAAFVKGGVRRAGNPFNA